VRCSLITPPPHPSIDQLHSTYIDLPISIDLCRGSLAVSNNRPNDPKTTVKKFQGLPTRKPGHTHVLGYDFVLLVPAFIDNVNPPYLARENELGINIDADYRAMITHICKAYTARWHL
ncbi:MAG: hypothetical protein ABSB13_09505, partial [Candidatus Binatus sp.]|uniref:hypothetical protein n=1 Tax=Candidatus Binatus sp. TaxID=2811406 RepID=UPI003D0E2D9B